jgi:hypothetical protein
LAMTINAPLPRYDTPPKRRSNHKGTDTRCEAYAERQGNDLAQLGVNVTDKAGRGVERIGKVVHHSFIT